jgi:hypothetical protein
MIWEIAEVGILAMAFDAQKARLDDLKDRVSRDQIIGVEVELLGLLASATNSYIRKNLRGAWEAAEKYGREEDSPFGGRWKVKGLLLMYLRNARSWLDSPGMTKDW